MTAPVVMNPGQSPQAAPSNVPAGDDDRSEKIAMTAPVTMERGDNGRWKMGFSMPADYTMDTLPLPLDKRVTLVEILSKTVAVIRFSGLFGDEERRSIKTDTLMKWLAEKKRYRVIGQPFYAGYDPPFTLPFLRRNEVLIEVQPI